MRRTLTGLLLALGLAAPAAALDGHSVLIGRIGVFTPRLSQANDLLVERTGTLSLHKSDWNAVSGGVELTYALTPFLEMGQHLDAEQSIVHRVPDRVSDASQLLGEAVSFGLTARLIPTRPSVRFAPYVGGGPDLLVWRYEETGDATGSKLKADGATLGFHATAGVRLLVSRKVALSAEYRRQFGGADMKGDFTGRHLDLAGTAFTAGAGYRF